MCDGMSFCLSIRHSDEEPPYVHVETLNKVIDVIVISIIISIIIFYLI